MQVNDDDASSTPDQDSAAVSDAGSQDLQDNQAAVVQQPTGQPTSIPSNLSQTLPEGETARGRWMYREESWGYELPPPNILREYDNLSRGYAARRLNEDIADRVYAREAHRRDQDGSLRALDYNAQGFKRGQYLGLAVALVFGGLGFLSGQTHHDWLGVVFGGGTVVSLTTVFVINRLAPAKGTKETDSTSPADGASPSSPSLPPGQTTQ